MNDMVSPQTLYDAVEYAAGHLPEYWFIEIHVERGSVFVDLFDEVGHMIEVSLSASGDIVEDIMDAVRVAKANVT